MYEDLQSLANLRVGKLMEYSTQEMLRGLQQTTARAAARGSLLTGATEQAKFDIRADAITKIARGIADTWLELIAKRNGRNLTREDVTFIMQNVEGYALTQAKHLGSAMIDVPGGPVVTGGPGRNWWMEQAEARMDRVAGDVRRDLEIKFQEQQAFPLAAQEVSPMSGPIQVHIHNANISNLNLGTQVGTKLYRCYQQKTRAIKPSQMRSGS